MKAAAYARVSTADQVDGFSLSAQLRAIRAHCASQGWTLAAEYTDEGVSASRESAALRPPPADGAVGQDGPVLQVPLVQLVHHEEGDVLAVELAGRSSDAFQAPGPSLRADLPAIAIGGVPEGWRQLAHQLGGVEDEVGLAVGGCGADRPGVSFVGVRHEVVQGECGDHRRLAVLLRNAEEAPAVAEVALRVAGVELVDPVLLPRHQPKRLADVFAGGQDAVRLDPFSDVGAERVPPASAHTRNLTRSRLLVRR